MSKCRKRQCDAREMMELAVIVMRQSIQEMRADGPTHPLVSIYRDTMSRAGQNTFATHCANPGTDS